MFGDMETIKIYEHSIDGNQIFLDFVVLAVVVVVVVVLSYMDDITIGSINLSNAITDRYYTNIIDYIFYLS